MPPLDIRQRSGRVILLLGIVRFLVLFEDLLSPHNVGAFSREIVLKQLKSYKKKHKERREELKEVLNE